MIEKKRNFFIYTYLCFFVALIFSFLLSSLQVDIYIDRVNYLVYANDSIGIFARNLLGGFSEVLFNEPLWLFINIALSTALSPENIVRVIIFVSTFIVFYLVLKNVEPKYFILALLILLLPQVLKNNIIHLRQGAAISCFLIGWFAHGTNKRYLFYIFAALIHSSFIIIIAGIVGVNIVLFLRLSYGVRNVIFTLVGFFVAFFGLYLAEILGARQGDSYKAEEVSVSGFAFIYWSGFFVLITLQGKGFLLKHVYSVFFIFLYLCTYFFLPVTARVFESVILLVLLSIIDFKGQYKYLGIIYFLMYFFALWVMRIDEPGFGWLA